MTWRALPPEELFRLLSRRHPTYPIAFRFRAAPDVRLLVRAVPPGPLADAFAEGGMGPVAAALETDDGRLVFASGHQAAGVLLDQEAAMLAREVADGLAVCCPWKSLELYNALEKGARHDQNFAVASHMWGTCDRLLVGSKVLHIPRPERYYGSPVVELSAGQVMAYEAACTMIRKHLE